MAVRSESIRALAGEIVAGTNWKDGSGKGKSSGRESEGGTRDWRTAEGACDVGEIYIIDYCLVVL
jgi:hypothetical protein